MLGFLLSGAMAPFTVALSLLVALMLLELVLSFVGGSLLGGGDGHEVDAGVDSGLHPELDAPDIDMPDIDMPDLDGVDLDGFDIDADGLDLSETSTVPASGVASFLGLGRTPFMIWFASLLLGFGAGGLALQAVADSVLGSPLPGWLAAVPALVIGWGVARSFGGLFARMVPQDETQSVSEAHLGRRQGIVTQGTAERGRPAEVRVTDRHGNPHYLRAEPLQDDARIPQGSTVLVLRDHRRGLYRLLAVD